MLSTFPHFSNEISTFSYRHRSASFAPMPSIVNGEVERRSLQERSRSKSVAVRNVFRALSWLDYSSYFRMFEICYVFHHFWCTCPPDHSLRSVWRAPPRRSGSPLGRRSGHFGRWSRPRGPASSRATQFPGLDVARECPNPRLHTSPRTVPKSMEVVSNIKDKLRRR